MISFFDKVTYFHPEHEVCSVASCLETVAEFCNTPGRWLINDWYKPVKEYKICVIKSHFTESNIIRHETEWMESVSTFKRALRTIVGIIFGLAGFIIRNLLMALAHFSKETRDKHSFTILSEEEEEDFMELLVSRFDPPKPEYIRLPSPTRIHRPATPPSRPMSPPLLSLTKSEENFEPVITFPAPYKGSDVQFCNSDDIVQLLSGLTCNSAIPTLCNSSYTVDSELQNCTSDPLTL